MIKRRQKRGLAKLSFKVVEILIAGVVISGFMQSTVNWGKVVFCVAMLPVCLIVALVFESGDDP